ncbi:hypothetical protein TCAL_15536 [Tigriopus californicus]|uniref:Uncharacterized protein n=1 Tax=Tigriopus californicus TaxID=6832 RepID=A0A553PS66_TIGCA|nr:hypothetical protein TCAL_15536 [Tigriopus californicus]
MAMINTIFANLVEEAKAASAAASKTAMNEPVAHLEEPRGVVWGQRGEHAQTPLAPVSNDLAQYWNVQSLFHSPQTWLHLFRSLQHQSFLNHFKNQYEAQETRVSMPQPLSEDQLHDLVGRLVPDPSQVIHNDQFVFIVVVVFQFENGVASNRNESHECSSAARLSALWARDPQLHQDWAWHITLSHNPSDIPMSIFKPSTEAQENNEPTPGANCSGQNSDFQTSIDRPALARLDVNLGPGDPIAPRPSIHYEDLVPTLFSPTQCDRNES